VTAAAERYLRALAEAGLRGAGRARFEAAADVLVFLGVVDPGPAQEMLNGLATALAVRAGPERGTLGGLPHPRWRQRRRPAIGLPTGAVRVAAIGTTLPAGPDGEARYLLSATGAPGRGVTVTVGGQRLERGWIDGSGTCDGVWWCLEVLLPEPREGLGRLEIATADGPVVAEVRVADEAGVAGDVMRLNGFSGLAGLAGLGGLAGLMRVAGAMGAAPRQRRNWPSTRSRPACSG
jgi:hypothetical protein